MARRQPIKAKSVAGNKTPAKGKADAKTTKAKTPKAEPIKYGAAALAKEMGVSPQKVRQMLRKQQGGTLEGGSRYNFETAGAMKTKAKELKELMKATTPKKTSAKATKKTEDSEDSEE